MIVLLLIVGLAVVRMANSLIQRNAGATSAFAGRSVRLGTAIVAGVVAVLIGYFLLVGDLNSLTRAYPTFAPLRSNPDTSLRGTVAYNALPIASHGKKLGCVDVVSASGGSPRQLFCANQPMAMGAALNWLTDGRLQATNRGQDHWSKIVNLQTGMIEETTWVKPPASTSNLATGPGGEKVTESRSRGRLRLTLTKGSASRVLLSIAVSRDYSLNNLAWSPDGKWFIAEDSAGQLLSITTGSKSSTRLLIDDGTEPAATDITF